MKRDRYESLQEIGTRLQEKGLPRPCAMEEDLRGNKMPVGCRGHIHEKSNLEKAWWSGTTASLDNRPYGSCLSTGFRMSCPEVVE